MTLDLFFARNPVFTREEFVATLSSQGVNNVNTQREILAYHVRKNHLIKLRRGLYAVVPSSVINANDMSVDSFLIAGRVTSDSILSYHTALDFHGVAYSSYFELYYLSHFAIKPFQFGGNYFRRIPFNELLVKKKQELLGVKTYDRQGMDIKVTTLERTLVDILDRPDLAGGWEEIWRSMEMVTILDIDLIIKYVLLLDNASTIAKLGFFLESHQQEFAVKEKYLVKLEQYCQKGKIYMDRRNRKNGKLISRWNLLVPLSVLEQSWEEKDESV